MAWPMVVGEDVVGEMDVAAGTLQGGDQRGEGFAAVVELFHAVAVADARRTAVPQHPLDAGRRPAVGGRHVPHGFAVSRQQVEQAAADRQEHDGQQPCDRYHGRLLLPQYGCRRGDCQQEICGEEKIHDQGRFLVRGILCAKKNIWKLRNYFLSLCRKQAIWGSDRKIGILIFLLY